MTRGSRIVTGDLATVRDRLRLVLAAANCQVTWLGESALAFRHGTNLTQTATMFPKRGHIELQDEGGHVRVDWCVEATGFMKYWLLVWAVLLCYAIFPPIFAWHVLVRKPEEFMTNLLAAL